MADLKNYLLTLMERSHPPACSSRVDFEHEDETVGAMLGQAIRRFHVLEIAAMSLVALLVWPVTSVVSGPQKNDYRLGPQDKIRVKVHEWRPSRDEIFEWKALSDEFTLGVEGTVSLPLIGEVPASGLATAELARSIADRLRLRMGLVESPDASVEIVKYRPFYIVGHIDHPGEFPYRPGLSVLQAVTIAGGQLRTSDQANMRLEREAISAKGELRLYGQETKGLLARRARLEAEAQGLESIQFPVELLELRAQASVALLLRQEQLMFEAHRESFKTQIEALVQLKSYLEQDVAYLNAQLAIEDTQLGLAQQELKGIAALVKKGFSTLPRQLTLERTVAQFESSRLRMGASLLKSRQEIGRAQLAMVELQSKRNSELMLDSRMTQVKLEEISQKFSTTESLLYEAEVMAPMLLAANGGQGSRRKQMIYKIVRQTNPGQPNPGQPAEMAASEATLVEPGDTIKVELPANSLAPNDDMRRLGTADGTETGSATAPAGTNISSRRSTSPQLLPLKKISDTR